MLRSYELFSLSGGRTIFSRGSGKGTVCSGVMIQPGMSWIAARRCSSGPSTSIIGPGEESRIAVLGKVRIRLTSAACVEADPR